MLVNGKENIRHFVDINGFNVWEIDCGKVDCKNQDGLKIELNFTPQKWFNLGLGISGTTLILTLLYLAYSTFNRKPKNSDDNKPDLLRIESKYKQPPIIFIRPVSQSPISTPPRNRNVW
jgi:hypothetical protein